MFQCKKYRAVGIQNKGAYLKMNDGVKVIVKNIKHVKLLFHQKALFAV